MKGAIAAAALAAIGGAGTAAADGCAAGATCVKVNAKGVKDPKGTFTAQCSAGALFPDFVDEVPAGYEGTRFKLSQQYPTQLPEVAAPWKKFDFKTQAAEYLRAILQVALDDLLAVGWRAAEANPPRWFQVPWMTAGSHAREVALGMTEERPVAGPELGLKPGVTIQNFAVGFYNARGGYGIGQFWRGGVAHPEAAALPEGTAVIKVLATDARAEDFADGVDLLAGAPSLSANVRGRKGGAKQLTQLRVLQIDVAVKDRDAGATGWVFGTFAYDRNRTQADPWQRMMPVGLMWGTATAAEGVDTHLAPAYAENHLGWQGRVNGPVDNPRSACLSCHATAQTGNNAPMAWDSPALGGRCNTDELKASWFRDLTADQPFGEIERATCKLLAGGVGSDGKPLKSLDFSLQQAVAFLSSHNPAYVNPCAQAGPLSGGVPRVDAFVGTRRLKRAAKNRYPIER